MTSSDTLKNTIYASLFAALIAAGAFIAIPVPIGPVPIVLQNFFIFLAALTLNWRWATGSVLIYLLAGAIGLPVFSAGRGGIGHFLGPTGGYLIGYIPAVVVVAVLSDFIGRTKIFFKAMEVLMTVAILLLGSAIVYLIGGAWLKIVLDVSWGKALAIGVIPFIIGDCIKIAILPLFANYTRKLVVSRDML